MGDPGQEREALIEAVAGAYRERDTHGGVRSHPAWHDLDDAGRVEASELAEELRALEAALDPEGLSATVKAVLSRIAAGTG